MNIGFFFQNNQIPQTISLVSKVLKLFSNLTNRVQRTRFCCAKSSVKRSSSMELKSSRLDFPVRLQTSSNQRTRKHRDGGNQTRKPNARGRRSLATASWNLHKSKSILSTLENTVSLWIRLGLGLLFLLKIRGHAFVAIGRFGKFVFALL